MWMSICNSAINLVSNDDKSTEITQTRNMHTYYHNFRNAHQLKTLKIKNQKQKQFKTIHIHIKKFPTKSNQKFIQKNLPPSSPPPTSLSLSL